MMTEAPFLEWILPVGRAAEIDWDETYRAELPRVLNYFRFRGGDLATAEDLASLTFEKAWRARRSYRRDRASVGTWLLTIARNVAVDHWRARRPAVSLDELGDVRQESTLEEDLQHRADQERLSALLAELPERERELVALKYGAGETNRAIARLTGLSESNVGTILSRTVAALRSRWAQGGSHD
jgi:RNA polymerase sigma-70 factor (ECF subfamily)